MAYAITSRRRAGRKPVMPARKRGNWKLAYADFLTALVAFFLLMWLVSGVSREDRALIAGEFSGRAPSAAPEPALQSQAGALASRIEMAAGQGMTAESLIVSASDSVIRLELVDSEGRALFDTGSGQLTGEGLALVRSAGEVLATMGFIIAIEGHTDAFTLAGNGPGGMLTNWELSSARANEARRVLEAAGVAAANIHSVTGFADTVPLRPGQPHHRSNRRISLELRPASISVSTRPHSSGHRL